MHVLLLIPALAAVVAAGPATAAAHRATDPAATAAGRCLPLSANFAPSSGDPNRLRVRFTVARFGRNRPVYLHYIAPNRRLRRTVLLGTARGLCGFLRTRYRPLFPFYARPGTWRLRFTNRRRYTVRPSRPYVTLAVTVLRAG